MTAPFMLMPETAMDEDDPTASREGDIRTSRSGLPLQPEPVAQPMQETAHEPFWFCIGAFYPCHDGATRLW
jgi:hypothetical protein